MLILPIVKEIYKKATSMPLASPYGQSSSIRRTSEKRSRNANNATNGASEEQEKKLLGNRGSSSGGGGTATTPTTTTTTTSSLSKASFMVSLRAATLLLPLYGLHYLVIVYRPNVQ